MTRDLRIDTIESIIVDVPTVRQHKLSQTSVTAQSYDHRTAPAWPTASRASARPATLGGPRWSEESVEAIKANIDTYLAPAVTGLAADRFEAAGLAMAAAAKRNNAAKGAIETAMFDGRRQDPRRPRLRPARRCRPQQHSRALDPSLR